MPDTIVFPSWLISLFCLFYLRARLLVGPQGAEGGPQGLEFAGCDRAA